MGLQQFERRLERMVEGVFAKAFRSGLQPVEVGRRLTREMDLRRTVAPRGTLTPNEFQVSLSPADAARFAPIEEELVAELVSVARDHARSENYILIGPVTVTIHTDPDLSPGTLAVAADLTRSTRGTPSVVLPDGRRLPLGERPFVLGRLPECELVLADSNVSRRHAELRPAPGGADSAGSGWVVADLGSTNGTKVNGMRINRVAELRDGDEVTVGATTIRFEAG